MHPFNLCTYFKSYTYLKLFIKIYPLFSKMSSIKDNPFILSKSEIRGKKSKVRKSVRDDNGKKKGEIKTLPNLTNCVHLTKNYILN